MINPRPAVELTREGSSTIIISIDPRSWSWMTSLKRCHEMKNRPQVRSLVFLTAIILLTPLLFYGIKKLTIWNMTRNYPRLTDSEVRELVQIDMSKDAVREHLGDPKTKSDGGRNWIYLNRNPNSDGHVSRSFGIQFKNDIVTRISFGSPRQQE